MIELPRVTVPRADKSIDWAREMSRYKSLKSEKQDFELWQKDLEVKVDTKGVGHFAVCFLTDIHLGAQGTDYDSLNKYRSAIIENPIYTVLLGDLADFFNPKILAHAMMGDVENPDEQMESVSAFLGGGFAEKTLGAVNGNHEQFATNSAGIDPMRWINKNFNIPLLQAGSVLTLKVDDEEYRIGMWHKLARYNSSLNMTHAGKQAMRMSTDNLDMVVSGDKHMGAMEEFVHKDRVGYVTQLGTFKTSDPWGREMGMTPPPQVFFPVFFFDGSKHEITPVRDLDTGVGIFQAFQEMSKKKGIAALGMAK